MYTVHILNWKFELNLTWMYSGILGQLREAASSRGLVGQELIESAKHKQYKLFVILYICLLYSAHWRFVAKSCLDVQ